MKVVNHMKIISARCLLFTLLLTSCRSKDGDFNAFSSDFDVQLGKQFSMQLEEMGGAPILSPTDYPEAYQHLNQITDAILKSNKILYRDEFPWEVYIIRDDSVLNAFCTPGGYIYVYTGIIKFLDSDDQLAGVIGHEIAHADLRHSTEQLTKNYGLQIILQVVLGESSFIGNAAKNLLSLSFSRSDETEADMQSVEYLMDTEYDPRGVARFFQKMEKTGHSSGPLQFLNTHPNPENRVDNIYNKWKSLGKKEGRRFTKEYQQFKESLP